MFYGIESSSFYTGFVNDIYLPYRHGDDSLLIYSHRVPLKIKGLLVLSKLHIFYNKVLNLSFLIRRFL